MLLKFNVKNYKSFKDLQEFSMIAGQTRKKEERLKHTKDFSILKFSAIFGANASGKSNFINALGDMKRLLVNGVPSFTYPIYFKLENEYKKIPTYFEVYLYLNNEVLSYGFEFDSHKNEFTSEWLVKIKNGNNNEKEIFSRDIINGKFSSDIKISKDIDERMNIYLDDFKKHNNELFLKYICLNKGNLLYENIKEIRDVYNWFLFSFKTVDPESKEINPDYFLIESKAEKLCDLLKMFGIGIKSISLKEVSKEEASSDIPKHLLNFVSKKLNDKKMDKKPLLVSLEDLFYSVSIENGKTIFKKIYFYHDEDKKYPFSIKDESDGTRRLIQLAEVLLTNDDNRLYAIDELDRKLHPQLTSKFIELFLEKSKKYNNQLIVSTHESRLLDFDILRRDEIWFANKEEDGESKIYSLEEFNERFDKKIDKAYLDGRYGGVPIFDSIFPFIK